MYTKTDIDKQTRREALLSCLLAILYFIWWYGFAYGLAPAPGDTVFPELLFGLPIWFFMSCIVGPLLFTLLCFIMVRCFFKNIPFETNLEEEK